MPLPLVSLVDGAVARRPPDALDASEYAVYQRWPAQDQLVNHSDGGSQYFSIKYTERLAEVKITPSVGGDGDSSTTLWLQQSIG